MSAEGKFEGKRPNKPEEQKPKRTGMQDLGPVEGVDIPRKFDEETTEAIKEVLKGLDLRRIAFPRTVFVS